jgi:monoamine oxidase
MTKDNDNDHRPRATSRRDFLRTAAGVAAAGAALPVAARADGAAAAPARADYDVIVLGGGFCGVTAARDCMHAGLRTLLVEARNRLGGRTFTAEFDGRPTDMGGTWVHWSQPHVWSEIRRYGLPLAETIGATAPKLIVRTLDGDIAKLDTAAKWDEICRYAAAYMGPSREIFPRPHNPFDSEVYRRYDRIDAYEPLTKIKGLPPVYRDLLDGFFATCGANYAREFAWIDMVRWYALPGHNFTDMNDAVVRYHFRDGTVSLINAIVADAGCEVRLGTPVAQVHQNGGRVLVQLEDGAELRSRVVISAIPLNVLKDVEWTPSLLPGKQQASIERHAGFCTKLHVVLDGELNVQCVAPSENPLNFLFTEHMHDGMTHMVGFGPSPDILDVNDSAQVQAAVRRMLPEAKLLKTFGYQWTADPFSQGTWCMLRPGQYSKYLRELKEHQGRVIFASADWADGWRGFIDGAIEQGIHAAREARRLLA